ncbi:CAP domain-containing protein [Ruminococcus sp. FC2018]|uniref:CAP domain-containing protein n=1 Tax=Ruminococcus sp. FC2018 TaxID=1410617 RepID=UPI0018CC770C|nr:CAP domain-containing protein [Ruminococcus sp. FC2018]
MTKSSDVVNVGLHGSYINDVQNAINRVNAIRKEACDQGVPDPRNSSRKLTPSDYVPIQWSHDLEEVARLRAAEAALNVSHTRPNGKSCFTVTFPGIKTTGNSEVLAWNWNKNMVSGINQFYDEKSDWVNKTRGVTGHYTSMINPSNKYMGLGCFYADVTVSYKSALCGRFSSSQGSSGSAASAAINNCYVPVQVKLSQLSRPSITHVAAIDKNDGEFKIVNISGSQNLSVGGTVSYEMWANVKCDTAYTASPVLLYEASWKSSNAAVASVDKYGKVTAKAPGSAVITASLGSLSKTVTISVPYKDISKCTASLSTASYVYDGQAKTPAVTVKDSSKTLSNGTDYTVSYSSNVNAGTATVTITGKGSYKNSKVLTFKITPKPQTAAQQTQKSDSSTVSTADKKSDSSKSASDNKSTDSKNSSDNKDNSDSKTDSSSVNGGEISNEKLSNENDVTDKESDDMIAEKDKDDDRADKVTEDTVSEAEEEQDREGTSDNNSNADDKEDKDNKFPVIPVAAGSAGGLLAVAAIVYAVKKSKSR